MRDRSPRYSEGNRRAGTVTPGSDIIVYPTSRRTSYYLATVLSVRDTPQPENPAVHLKIRGDSGRRYASIGGGTAITVISTPPKEINV